MAVTTVPVSSFWRGLFPLTNQTRNKYTHTLHAQQTRHKSNLSWPQSTTSLFKTTYDLLVWCKRCLTVACSMFLGTTPGYHSLIPCSKAHLFFLLTMLRFFLCQSVFHPLPWTLSWLFFSHCSFMPFRKYTSEKNGFPFIDVFVIICWISSICSRDVLLLTVAVAARRPL